MTAPYYTIDYVTEHYPEALVEFDHSGFAERDVRFVILNGGRLQARVIESDGRFGPRAYWHPWAVPDAPRAGIWLRATFGVRQRPHRNARPCIVVDGRAGNRRLPNVSFKVKTTCTMTWVDLTGTINTDQEVE